MSAFITAIRSALAAADAYAKAIEEARNCPEVKGKSEDVIRANLLPIVAEKFAVPVIDGKGKATGKKVLDSSAANYEAAKKALQRLMADLMGKTSGKGEEFEVPEHIAALAAKLAKACAEYEQARKLASTALANAFAK
jgi:hypothetical protein